MDKPKKMYRVPLEWGKKGKPRRPSQVTTQIVSSEEPPSIWVRAPSGNSGHTSACGLPQHPCAKPSKINTKLFHHRLRFTARSITGVVVLERCRHQSRATFYQGAQARKLPLIKWKPWSKCKWPIVERVAGVTGFPQPGVLGGWFGSGGEGRAFVRPQSRSD